MSASELSSDSLTRDRAVRLFAYLRELARLKTRVVTDLSAYDDGVVWFGDVPQYEGCFSVLSLEESERAARDVWLEVRKVAQPKKPPIPASCLKWVADSPSDDPLVELQLKDEIPAEGGANHDTATDAGAGPEETTSTRFERLVDHPEVSAEFQRYIQEKWLPWSEVYRRWKAADHLYVSLFSIHRQLEKLGEEFELIIGLGLLTWRTPENQAIRRHIAVGDAHLTFEAAEARFQVQGAWEGVKLRFETEMVDPCHLPAVERQRSNEALLEAVQESPWDKNSIDEVLRSWVNSLTYDPSMSTYSDSPLPPHAWGKAPTVTFAPAIILRRRNTYGQIQCFNAIREQIEGGGTVPSAVRLVADISQNAPEDESGLEPSRQAVDSGVYLPLPANEEQLRIVHQVERRLGVLVQGPPGTGKSHTIANLICHLLAQGKRVLVTSQTPRALRVLKDKMPDELRALCVTLLGNDQAAREELRGSVETMSRRHSEWNPAKSQEAIASLEQRLFEVRTSIADTKRLLREQREIETYEHEAVRGTYRGTAQQIALRVADERSSLAWVDDDPEESQDCPMSSHEFGELLRLCRAMPEAQCAELRKEWVSRDSLPDVTHFITMVDEERLTRERREVDGPVSSSPRFAVLTRACAADVRSLRKAVADLLVAAGAIKTRFAWAPEALSDVLSGNDTPWRGLRDFMASHLSGLSEKAALTQGVEVQFQKVDRNRLRADAGDLLKHLEAGGRAGWGFIAPGVVRRTRYVGKQARVNGQDCTTKDRLRLLVAYLEALGEVEVLWSALEGKDNRQEGSVLLQVGYLQERLESLEEILRLRAPLTTASECVNAIEGLAEPEWSNIAELEGMVRDLEAAECEHAFVAARGAIEDCAHRVRVVVASPRAHNVNPELLTALERRDAKSLAGCLERLQLLGKGRDALANRDRLQERLNGAAPRLGRQLQATSADSAWDERAGSFEAAWAWRQADRWLTRFKTEHDKARLEAELERLSEDEQATISKLAAAKAWHECLGRLTRPVRASLAAWETAMNRLPKTRDAKTRPKLLRAAREAMDNCKEAVPAWVMPLYRVFETIRPAPGVFDVAIIDEASQTGPEGLVLAYLAKQCIVVGDDQQINPETFIAVGAVAALVDKWLHDFPFKDLFGPEISLFAQAKIYFGRKIVLREHFRCVPEIIEFSNRLCYADMPLLPLRQYPPDRLNPPILVTYVKDGSSEGPVTHQINRREADTLVEALVQACSKKEYRDKTMGVISLLGEAQAKYIERQLLTRLSASEIEKRRIVCGDAYAFQGDERDVMFLSMVSSPDRAIGPLTGDAAKRRFNVAASRARDQLVLFHTATVNDLNPDCMRYKLLAYCQNPTTPPVPEGLDLNKLRELARAPGRRPGSQPKPFDSWFELDVFLDIAARGFRAVPQYQVGYHPIDLAVYGTKVAVECDGDHHLEAEQLETDAAIDKMLKRAGWTVLRIPGYEYYHDRVGSLQVLWKTLKEMGIDPWAGGASASERVEAEPPPQAPADAASKNHAASDRHEEVQGALPLLSGKVQDAAEPSFDLVGFLTRRGIRFKDMRARGGAVWLIGGSELTPIVAELKARGISFSYSPRGGRASGHRPAWYSSTASQPTAARQEHSGLPKAFRDQAQSEQPRVPNVPGRHSAPADKSDRDFRLRVKRLLEEGHSLERLSEMLGVSIEELQEAIKQGEQERD